MSLRALITYSISSSFVQTTHEYLDAFRRFLEADVEYLHVATPAVVPENLDSYDVIINSYCARFSVEGHLSESYLNALKSFRGLKILAVQDEYEYTNRIKSAISTYGFDYVLTCVPQQEIEYVYPKTEFPHSKFVTVLTGYVPDSLLSSSLAILPLADRTITVGYRGRDIGGAYGRLGYQKYEIGRRMREICEARGIPYDIAMDEQSRIYGTGWLDFVGQCRTMLGSESGSNVFDFDGSIARQYLELKEANHGRPPSYEEFRPFVEARDNEINMGQVSPRIFECAVMKTPMILFRGQYSGVVQADLHYIPLEHDFSNVDEVLSRIEDLDALAEMAERTHAEVVLSGRYGYPTFVGQVRRLIEEGLSMRQRPASKGRSLLSVERAAPPPFPAEIPTSVVGHPEAYLAKQALFALTELADTTIKTISSYKEACSLAEAELILARHHSGAMAREIAATREATDSLWHILEEIEQSISSFCTVDSVGIESLYARAPGELKLFREKAHHARQQTLNDVEVANRRYNEVFFAIDQMRIARRRIEGASYRDAATPAEILKVKAELEIVSRGVV